VIFQLPRGTDDRSPASTYGLNQRSTSALSSSTTPTPATPGDNSYHGGGSPATPTTIPIQAPPLPNTTGQSGILSNLPNKLLPKSLTTKKDTEKDMLLIDDDI